MVFCEYEKPRNWSALQVKSGVCGVAAVLELEPQDARGASH